MLYASQVEDLRFTVQVIQVLGAHCYSHLSKFRVLSLGHGGVGACEDTLSI